MRSYLRFGIRIKDNHSIVIPIHIGKISEPKIGIAKISFEELHNKIWIHSHTSKKVRSAIHQGMHDYRVRRAESVKLGALVTHYWAVLDREEETA